MAGAASEVAICNLGLGWLGANLIISLDDPSIEAQLCKANYSLLRNAVLEAFEWTFAQRRFLPAQLTATPAWGYTYSYQIPGDILRLHYVGNTDRIEEDSPSESWAREGSLIQSDDAAVFCRGTEEVTDVSKFSPSFVQALAARIAADLAMPLTSSNNLQMSMAKMYAGKIGEAERLDGKQGKSRVLSAPGMVQAHRAGGSGFLGPTV